MPKITNLIKNEQSRCYGLDFLRFLSAYAVIMAHLVYAGTLGKDGDFLNYVNADKLPLFSENWIMHHLDVYLISNYSIALGQIGVMIFFLISGWLVPEMLMRYTRKNFIINRFFRIFPLVMFSSILTGLIINAFGVRQIGWLNILSSGTLLYELFDYGPINGVLWTLVIEIEFAILVFLVGKIDWLKIFAIFSFVIIYNAISLKFTILRNEYILHNSHFILLMLLGWGGHLAVKYYKHLPLFLVIILLFFANYHLINLHKIPLHQNTNLLGIAVSVIIFFIFIFMDSSTNIFRYRFIKYFSDSTYSLYLLHLPLGITMIYFLRDYCNNYLTLVITVISIQIISLFSFMFIEKPFFKYRYKKF